MLINLRDAGLSYEVRHIDAAAHWTTKLFGGQYRRVPVLAGLRLEVSGPGVTAILGRNGAGKTTLMKVLSGILTPTSGIVEVLGFEPARRKKEFLRQIGAVFGQKRMLWPELSLRENFALTRAVYGVAPVEFRRRAEELTELFGLRALTERPLKSFSLGESMKAEVANVLLFEPKVLFLDEPTIGLDVSAQAVLRRAIKAYVAARGCHILLTSHYMRDVAAMADRVLMLENGALAEIDSRGSDQADLERRLEDRLSAAI